ncbi:MAG: hypothetical protein R3D84_06760 [Paracoccaceae bacterium]
MADAIAAAMPDARFVCVTRDTADFVRSRLWSYGRVPPPYPRRALVILRAVASAIFHERYLRGFVRRAGPGRAIAVRFALRDVPENALAPVFESLGLPPHRDCDRAFRPIPVLPRPKRDGADWRHPTGFWFIWPGSWSGRFPNLFSRCCSGGGRPNGQPAFRHGV